MKKSYKAPKVIVHGSVNTITQQTKTTGRDDGVTLIIDNLTPAEGVSIGSLH